MQANISTNKSLLKKNIDLEIQIPVNMLFLMNNLPKKEITKLRPDTIPGKSKNGPQPKNHKHLDNTSMPKSHPRLLTLTS